MEGDFFNKEAALAVSVALASTMITVEQFNNNLRMMASYGDSFPRTKEGK